MIFLNLNEYVRIFSILNEIKNFIIFLLIKNKKILYRYIMCFIYFFALNQIFYSSIRLIRVLKINFRFIKILFLLRPKKVDEINYFSRFSVSPEKMLFNFFLILNLLIISARFNVPKFLRYNMILVVSLLTMHTLFLCWFDFFYTFGKINENVRSKVLNLKNNNEFSKSKALKSLKKKLMLYLIIAIAVIFTILFIKLFLISLQNKYSSLKGLDWLTGSARFWVKLKASKPIKKSLSEEN